MMLDKTGRRQAMLGLTLRLDAWLAGICRLIVLLTILILLLGLSCNVFMRYLFQGGGIVWMTELPSLLFPWMVSAGIVLAAQQGAHIRIDLLHEALSSRHRRWLVIVLNLLVISVYMGLFSVLLEMMEIVSIERSPLLDMPSSWSYAALLFCAAGVVISTLLRSWRVLMGAEEEGIGFKGEVVSP